MHETGDGTPKGLVAALGWEKIVGKTANEVLVAVLDAMVLKVGLVVAAGAKDSAPKLEPKPEPAVPPAAALPKSKAEAEVAPAPQAEAPAGPVSQQPPPDEAWAGLESVPPSGAPGSAGDEGINVVVDDEVLIADRIAPLTTPRIRAASPSPAPVDEEDTEVKAVPRVRSERPPARGPSSRR